LLSTADLKRFLSNQLPEAMVPSSFVILESLPRTLNGKIDRRNLPAPGEAIGSRECFYEPPHTPVECLIAEIWRELLHVDSVGVHDNFFDLGGHSLLSLQVVARLEKELRVRISPRELAFQTLGQLAAVCDSRPKAAGKPRRGKLTGHVMQSIGRVFSSR
jgi:acyl carrier protein